MTELCDDESLSELIALMQNEQEAALAEVERLLRSFSEDARLHFMRGSMLIGLGRLIEAHASMSRAVELAPDYAIARFQFGFFQLTSGEADAALETWGRLDRLPDGHYLRHFVDGLRRLIRDDFMGAIASLRAGIAANSENQPLSHDMQLIVDRCLETVGAAEEATSETSLILRQLTRGRQHDR